MSPTIRSGAPPVAVDAGLMSPITAISQDSPSGTCTVCRIVSPLPPLLVPDTGTASTLPPSLPIISLVIANLNPRDLMQLARLGVEVVIPHDSVRHINRLAHA